MLKHLVMFKLKPQAAGTSKEENANKLKSMLDALIGKISQLRSMEVGINSIPGEAAYDMSIYSEFANAQDLAAYAQHPEHLKVRDFVLQVVESRVSVDYIV
jgi:hypothetical protein